jgi:hypothetical protein
MPVADGRIALVTDDEGSSLVFEACTMLRDPAPNFSVSCVAWTRSR